VETGASIRLQLTVHYDGSGFRGWQFQPDQRTVQGELEAALSRLANHARSVLGSGRTDTGVHATGQVASVDMPSRWTPEQLHRSLNAILPRDIWIEQIRQVRPDFHPRYDAVARTYEYRIGTASPASSPFHRRWCWPVTESLEVGALEEAAAHLEGEHSFLAFAKAGQPERGDRCTVASARWSSWELGPCFTIVADRYLHHMVRYLVGTMVDMGRARRPVSDLPALLAQEGELTTSPPAPAEGLFLARVEYPEHIHRVDDPTTNHVRSTTTA
jgi:tRNA pseudouridine38-40 synthase